LNNTARILFVDDEESQRKAIGGFIEKKGYYIKTCPDGDTALDLIRNESWDIVLSDLKMPGMNGIELLRRAKELVPDIVFILFTAYGTVEGAVEAMKLGAFDFITKPVDLDVLEIMINKALENRRLLTENRRLRELVESSGRAKGIISESARMEEVINLVARAAPSSATVLITGESGTGKERIARAIHYGSKRADQPMITVNCAAIPETLLEAELFGHEKGAFTGAHIARKGKIESAQGGTLFIDEIGDMPLSLQPKLLRFLQEGTIEKLGSAETKKLDIRVIVATHRYLRQMVEKDEFREDLFFRLSVINIDIPPLRERKQDILPLAEHFIKIYSEKNSKKVAGLSRAAKDLVLKYSYPGNVRELENAIEAAVVLSRDEVIDADDLPANFGSGQGRVKAAGQSLPELLEAYEKSLVMESLKKSAGNKSEAARILGISEKNIRDRLKKWGLSG
jgi:two-component system NtrC family response regulator